MPTWGGDDFSAPECVFCYALDGKVDQGSSFRVCLTCFDTKIRSIENPKLRYEWRNYLRKALDFDTDDDGDQFACHYCDANVSLTLEVHICEDHAESDEETDDDCDSQ